jgi:hypothetical protein
MKKRLIASTFAALLMAATGPLAAQAEPKGSLQGMTAPKPDVPQLMTLQGEFVRMAYNNEGYAVLGYRIVQDEVGKPWVLLNVGITLMEGAKDYKLKREHLTLKTPDGKVVPLATQQEYAADPYLRPLNQRAKVVTDSINYFPAGPGRPCPMQFFADLDRRGLAYDSVDLTDNRDCMGRIYFKVPGGIQVGQYWLQVQFASSVVQVPFRVFTKEQEKDFRKQWEDLKKAHDEAFK